MFIYVNILLISASSIATELLGRMKLSFYDFNISEFQEIYAHLIPIFRKKLK